MNRIFLVKSLYVFILYFISSLPSFAYGPEDALTINVNLHYIPANGQNVLTLTAILTDNIPESPNPPPAIHSIKILEQKFNDTIDVYENTGREWVQQMGINGIVTIQNVDSPIHAGYYQYTGQIIEAPNCPVIPDYLDYGGAFMDIAIFDSQTNSDLVSGIDPSTCTTNYFSMMVQQGTSLPHSITFSPETCNDGYYFGQYVTLNISNFFQTSTDDNIIPYVLTVNHTRASGHDFAGNILSDYDENQNTVGCEISPHLTAPSQNT